MQWNSPKNAAKTGGQTGWTPQPMAATTGANYRPMVSDDNNYIHHIHTSLVIL